MLASSAGIQLEESWAIGKGRLSTLCGPSPPAAIGIEIGAMRLLRQIHLAQKRFVPRIGITIEPLVFGGPASSHSWRAGRVEEQAPEILVISCAIQGGTAVDSKKLVTGAALVAAVVCAVGWLLTQHTVRDLQRTQVTDALDPITEMLQENAAIAQELRGAPYAEGDNDVVNAYMIKIRGDGVPQHSDMKQRIDRLVNNNTAILALLAKYSTHTRTPAFRASAERFRDYAISLRDRWQSVPEIFMAGGNLPAAGPMLPADFPQEIAAEAR